MHEFTALLLTFDMSDYFVILAAAFALWFTISYAFFSPWYTHPLGVITLLTSLSVCALLVLIVYGVIFGVRIGEEWRFPITLLVLVSYMAKVTILHVERRRGRIARRKRAGGIPATGPIPVVPTYTPRGGDSDE